MATALGQTSPSKKAGKSTVRLSAGGNTDGKKKWAKGTGG
jgi:hypothetical protein